jgi:hypothetical protein
MSDWDLPALSSLWADFLDELKARDLDAISLGLDTIVNPVTGMMRWNRADDKFQEYDGASWVDQVLSVAGGGTGSNTPSGAITALGLGTMAVQDANAVNIIGGTISGLSSIQVNGNINGSTDIGIQGNTYLVGALHTGPSLIQLTNPATGRIPALTGSYFDSLAYDAANLTGVLPAIQGHNLTTLNAAVLGAYTGYAPAGALGSGAVGSGLKVLLDNNTWGNYSAVREIVRGDVSFGTGDTSHDSTITWLNGTPGSIKEIVVQLDGPMGAKQSGNGFDAIGIELINITTIRFYKIQAGGPAGTPQPSAHYYTAVWYRIG